MAKIPSVRDWKVTYYQNDIVIGETTVSTIKKRFAAWEARDVLGWTMWRRADKITVSVYSTRMRDKGL